MSRFVRPETKTLTLANGDTLRVKCRLSAGEQRARFARMSIASADGVDLKLDRLGVGLATITTYLVDWHLQDDPDVAIRGVSVEELTATLDNLDPEAFTEILTAIETHEAAMLAERTAAKNVPAGETGSPAILPSPSDATGALSGSESSTSTTTTS